MRIEVVQNDKGYDLNFTLQDSTGAALDLTGAAIKLKAQHQDNAALAFNGSVSIVSAVAGTCKYTVADGDFISPGDYYAEIEVTIGTKVVTYSDIVISVLPELPRS